MRKTRIAFQMLLLSGITFQGADVSLVKDNHYKLYDYLFASHVYKKEIRPSHDHNNSLDVFMTLYLLSLIKVDEKRQTLVSTARLQLLWKDDYLSWNSTEFGGVTEILVPQEIVYLPDVELSNSVTAHEHLGYNELPVRLYSEGTIDWEPTLLMSTACNIDITYFPFDTQICFIEFETAVSQSHEININVHHNISSATILQDFTTNGQWELLETKAENISVHQSKSTIRFSLIMKRRRTFYIMNIGLPVFFLSQTASLMFALPADEGEKMGTGITVLLAFAVYLTIVSDLVPNTSLEVSILGLYLTVLLGMCAISTVICVFILRLHFRDAERPVGPKTKCIICLLRRILCQKKCYKPSFNQPETSTNSRSNLVEENGGQTSGSSSSVSFVPNSPPSTDEMTWQIVAQTLDITCFILFSLLSLTTTSICLLYLFLGSKSDEPSL